jgi:hypothetical protein
LRRNHTQIEGHFERASQASEVEPDIFKGATAEEAERLRETLEYDRRMRRLRDWVKAMNGQPSHRTRPSMTFASKASLR